jgi:DNA gyrase subunit A
VAVVHSSGNDDILIVSQRGQAIRFHERETRPMGRATSGVIGMKLRRGDEVIAVSLAKDDSDLLVVTDQGYGKRTLVADYPVKGRGGLGVKTVQLTQAKGQLAGALVVRDGYQVMLISTGGTVIRMPVDGIRRAGRATQGVIVMRPRGRERVSTLAPVIEQANGAEPDEESAEPEGEAAPAEEPAPA